MSQPSIYDRCLDFAHYSHLAAAFGQVLFVDTDPSIQWGSVESPMVIWNDRCFRNAS